MAPTRDTPAKHHLPHIRIEQFRREKPYSPPPKDIEESGPRPNNVAHGKTLKRQRSAAYARARAAVAARRSSANERIRGVYLEVEGSEHEALGDLTWESKGIRAGALRVDDNVQKAAVFVPLSA